MKKILAASAALLLVMAFATTAAASNPPFGNDGDNCHGANQETCRPDPQPSHGADCDAHGNNPDGNDDHCAGETAAPTPVVTPSPTPEATPTPAPTSETTPAPTPTPDQVDTGGGNTPRPTLPQTDTEMTSDQASTTTPILPIVLVALLLIALLAPRRRAVR